MNTTTPPNHLPLRLAGLNIEAAMDRLDNDGALYVKLAGAYGPMLKAFASRFRALVAADDAVEARRHAHTLKGAAGTIGAETLEASARALEDACKNNDAKQTQLLLPTVENDIAEVLGSIAVVLQTNGETPSC